MNRSSNWTGRSARSMADAFGPYTDNRISEPEEPMHPTDRIVIWASAIAACALVGLIVWGSV